MNDNPSNALRIRRTIVLVVGGLLLIAAAAGAYLRLQHERARVVVRPPWALMSHEEQLRHHLFGQIQPVALKNCELKRFGEPNDGGYLLCANLLGDVGAAYSYGISGYDAWGCDVSRAARVPVHQYDCFDVTEPVCAGGHTVFHPECVGLWAATIDGHSFDTIQHQVRKNGDRRKHLVVKMDVEGSEWDTLLDVPTDLLERIDQLVVEFHGVGEKRYIQAVARLKDYFHVAHLHINNYTCRAGLTPFPGWAYEVLFVNKRLGVVDDGAAVQLPRPQDAPNAPQHPDCQHVAVR